MRNPFTSRKRVAVAAAGAAVLFGGVTALAYWTTTGSGSGTGIAASSNGTVVLTATVPDGIYPGGSVVVPVTGTTSGTVTTDAFVTSVALDNPAFSVDSNHLGCVLSDLSFDVSTLSKNVVIHHGQSNSLGSSALVLANSNLNQNACQGASITVHLTSS